MNRVKTNHLLAATALILSGGGVIGCAANILWLHSPSWLVRIGVLGCGVALAGGSFALLRCSQARDRQAVQRHFDALCALDPLKVRGEVALAELPPLPTGSPWKPLGERMRHVLFGHCQAIQDLEHRRAALEVRYRRARDEVEKVRAILAGLSDPVIVIDSFAEVVVANAAAESIFQFDLERAEDRALAQLVQCERLVELLTDTCHLARAGQRSDDIQIADAAQHGYYRAQVGALPSIHGEDDDPTGTSGGAVAVLRDIGREKALQTRNAEFVSAVTHEMKTPLAGIKAYVELLADGDAEDEEMREEFLAVINSQADRLQRLIDNVLNLARIEAGVVQVNKQDHSLNDLLEEAIHVVQPAAESKTVELKAELSPLYLSVLADRDMLLQSAINLLSNAVKYTPESGRVTLRSRLVDDRVIYEVEDTGVGLSEEDCKKVFDKFYRVKANKDMASGTGLGLPLAKHIVENVHGGRLTVESAESVGSTFTVMLRQARAHRLTPNP